MHDDSNVSSIYIVLITLLLAWVVFLGFDASNDSKVYWKNVGPYWDNQYNPNKYDKITE